MNSSPLKIAIIFTNRTGVRGVITPKEIRCISEVVPDAQIYLAESSQELIDAAFDADVLVCWTTFGGHYIAEKYTLWDKNLKWVHSLSAGIEGLMCTQTGRIPNLRYSTSSGIHGIPMAEHTLALMLMLSHKFPALIKNQMQSKWERPYPDELFGKTLAIVGAGKIGQLIAKRAKAFDMEVIGVKRTPTPLPNFDQMYSSAQVDDALRQADYVVRTIPANSENEKFMNADRFHAMKHSAYFLNVGRGMCCDQEALVQALTDGSIAGAALDVTTPEPLPAESPLWEIENVIITPHVSAETPKYMERAIQQFCKNIPLFLEGKPLIAEVYNREDKK